MNIKEVRQMQNEEVKDYKSLTEKQKRFIDFYIEKPNAAEAARKAGYSSKTADRIGHENLIKLEFFIKQRLQEFEDKRVASLEEVLQFLSSGMRGEIKDQFDLDPAFQDRIRCAELLGKRHGAFVDKKELSGGYTVEIVDDVDE